MEPAVAEREYITLLCIVNPNRDRVRRFYVFPSVKLRSHRSHENDPWLGTGIRLKSLSELYAIVKTIHDGKCKLVSPVKSEVEAA